MMQTTTPQTRGKGNERLHQAAEKALAALVRGKAAGLCVPGRIVAQMAVLAMRAAPEGINDGVGIS